jgi:hypothetical protein
VVRAFARGHPRAQVTELEKFDHNCCWIAQWPLLLHGATHR